MWFGLHRFVYQVKQSLGLSSALEKIIKQPVYKQQVFDQAFSHGGGVKRSYDRLEFLGDAVLESVISEYLYDKFPEFSEGKLTQIRSRLVRRSALNLLGYRIGLGELIQSEFLNFENLTDENKRIFGDTLESLIGAVYLNTGYEGARHFILQVLVDRYVKVEDIAKSTSNYKGVLQELAQKLNFSIRYQQLEKSEERVKMMLLINNQPFITASSKTKKKAEQSLARKAIHRKAELYSFIKVEEDE